MIRTNKTIKALNKRLSKVQGNVSEIEEKLQQAYNELFMGMTVLNDAVSELEQSNDYATDQYGEIASWIRFDLSDFQDCKEYFKSFMREHNFVEVDFDNDCLMYSHGPDSIVIQDDTRRDNGVWLNGDCIIKESDYKTEDGEVDETKRNKLIEAYMEHSGYFPGVFRVDYHGNISPVNTKEVK